MVAGKVQPRKVTLGVFALDGTRLSELRALVFDSADPEPRNREQRITLALSRAADHYNNQEVELRLEETPTGTSQTDVYKRQRVRLIKPFANDFDES